MPEILPNAENAEIPIQKLRDYLLSPIHPVGRFKAAYFRSLGFTLENAADLITALRQIAESNEAIAADRSKYGQKYVVRGSIRGPSGGISRIETVWIVLNSASHPRFITAYPGE